MTIKDPVLNPYQIEIDSNNHTVQKSTDRLNKKNEPVFEIVGYYSSVEAALTKIARIKSLENNKASALMIRDYISELKEITQSIINHVKL